MGQETHYYNNIIAQLIELRDETKKNNEDSQVGMNAKLDEVIDAIEKIQVTAENIKIEAGTINLSTDEVEALLKIVNTNLGIINENINEFDTNVNDELEKFITKVHDDFTTFTNFITTENTAIKTHLTTKVAELITKINDEFTKLKTANATNKDEIIITNTGNKDEIIKTISDEFTKLNKNITDSNSTSDTTVTDKLDEVKTDIITNDNTIATTLSSLITVLKDANHTDLTLVKTTLDTINSNIDTEIASLKTNGNTNHNAIIEKLNTTIAQIGDVTSPVEGSVTKLLRTINDSLTNSGTDTETNLTELKTVIETASTEIQTLITNNHNVIHDDLFNNGKPIPGILRRLELITRGKTGDIINDVDITNTILGELIATNTKLTHINDASHLIKSSVNNIDNVTGQKSDAPDANNGSIHGKLRYIANELPNIIDKLQTDIQISDTETIKESIANIFKSFYINFNEHKYTVENISKYSYEIDTAIGKIIQLLGIDDTEGISLLLNNIIKAINDAASTEGEISLTTNQLITDIKTLVDSIKTNNGTDTKSIVDAINAIKVTAESIKIDAGTINLSTDEVEGLLKTSNTNLQTINSQLLKKEYTPVNGSLENYSLYDLLKLLVVRFGTLPENDNNTFIGIAKIIKDNTDEVEGLLKSSNSNLESGNDLLTDIKNSVNLIEKGIIGTPQDTTVVKELIKTNSALGNIADSPNLTGSLNAKLAYVTHKQETILTELINIKTAINDQTTSITNAMTAQTEAIVEAINNITGNGTHKIVMVEYTPPQPAELKVKFTDPSGEHNISIPPGTYANYNVGDTIHIEITRKDGQPPTKSFSISTSTSLKKVYLEPYNKYIMEYKIVNIYPYINIEMS